MFLLKQLFALLRLLHSDTESKPLAIGVAMGFILGLTPALSLQGLLLLLLLIFIRIQVGAALLSWLLFSFVPFFIPTLLNSIGLAVLESSFLKGLWIFMYQAPILPLSQFNNSIVMGGFLFGIVFSPLIYFITLILVKKYRDSIGSYIQKTKFMKVVKGSKIYNWYATYEKNWS